MTVPPVSEITGHEDLLLPAALEAGRAIMAIYGRPDIARDFKDDGSPLTEADEAADRIIHMRLRASGIPVLSEEGAEAPERRTWREFWCVDPLDGTKEFLKRNGEFTVNIARVVDGRVTEGIVHAPALGLTWYGLVGRDAWRIGADGRQQRISAQVPADAPLRVLASRSHLNPETESFLRRLPAHRLVSSGSSIKFARIAEGSADLYPRFAPTMEWDTAAGQAVLEAAGGAVITRDGRDLSYNKPVLRNPHFLALGDPAYREAALLTDTYEADARPPMTGGAADPL